MPLQPPAWWLEQHQRAEAAAPGGVAAASAWRSVIGAHPIKIVGQDSIFQRCGVNASDISTAEQRYGEPTADGLYRLLQQWPDECAIDNESVVYDVGSGFGRLCAYLRLHTNASAVRGLEINECRHHHAEALRETVRRVLPSAGALDFILGDVRQLGFGEATHVLLAAQTWGEALLTGIFRQALAARRVRCVSVISSGLPRGWTRRVSTLASTFGHTVVVNYLPTTYATSAAAVFFRRGQCAREEHTVTAAAASRRSTALRCMSMGEMARRTRLNGVFAARFGGRIW